MQVLDVFETEGEVLLICELLANGSLLDLLQREGAQSESAARSIIRQIASGLKAVHEAGIVHRDLKPSNAIINRKGYLQLSDFGLSGKVGSTSKSGTRGYWSPETVRRQPQGAASDWWSLGVTLFPIGVAAF